MRNLGFSNYSTNLVDITAVGRDVVSTVPGGGEGNLSGTSMAAGNVTGAAAAALGLDLEQSAAELKNRLISTADRLENLQNKANGGRLLNLANALEYAKQDKIITVNYEDDFDVHGYMPDEGEAYELFASNKVIQVEAGLYHSLALKDDGTVWSCGYNYYGQCGTGDFSQSSGLSKVIGLKNIVKIAAGAYHSLALTANGEVWAWGANWSGQLGGRSTDNRNVPVQIDGLSDELSKVTDISASDDQSFAIKNGNVYMVGGEFFDEDSYNDYNIATTYIAAYSENINGLNNITKIATDEHNLALDNNGDVWDFTREQFCSLNWSSGYRKPYPKIIRELTGITDIYTCWYYTFARNASSFFEINYSTSTNYMGFADWISEGIYTYLLLQTYSPTTVTPIGLTNVESIHEDGGGYIILDNYGAVWRVNYNYYFPLKPNEFEIKSISSNQDHALFLRNDGTVSGWGSNYYRQLDIVDNSLLYSSVVINCETQPGDYVSIPIAVSNAYYLTYYEFRIEYNPDDYQLVSACEYSATPVWTTGLVYNTNVNITAVDTNAVSFKVTENIDSDVINIVKLKAIRPGNSPITCYRQG